MIYNVGHLTGIRGEMSEYFFHAGRYFTPHGTATRKRKQELADHLVQLIDEVRPDVLFLAEIRDEAYLDLIKSLFSSYAVDPKYGTTFIGALPFMKGNSSGVFMQSEFQLRRHYMSRGVKRLIQEVELGNGASLFFGHFSLGKAARTKQFQDVADLVKRVPHPIIAGDFNILHGAPELQELLVHTGLSIVNHPDDMTYPTASPRMALDLFLAPPTIEAAEVAVLHSAQMSDHLPVVADITIQG